MNIEDRNTKYNNYVARISPRTSLFSSIIKAFIVGGLICCIGQAISDLLMLIPDMTIELASSWTSISLIFLASLLTGLGIYEKIGKFAGAGSIVPITGFSNSITSPAIEFKQEGVILGMSAKMFVVAGPVLVNGITASVIIGIIYWLTIVL
ncbi:MAG: stage V sporulation protein AC [Clostridia bacterium]|jgi:stage V sporulation protein AC|nr:stage V sporulation protein AC [Clostridia bacterium]MDD4275478.1 stage V sporulation protein AC [Clostridia bacterium]